MKRCLPWFCCLLLIAALHAAEVAAPAARTIVLVRHGDYLPDATADKLLGPHLAPIGLAQAHLVAARAWPACRSVSMRCTSARCNVRAIPRRSLPAICRGGISRW